MGDRVLWAELRADELRALAAEDTVVIVPVAAIEQHGPHLPVEVDTLLTTEIARRAALRLVPPTRAIVTPPVWSGLSEHHMPFGGTLSVDFPTFHALLRCLCRSIERHGFRRVLLLNGHGGNIAALQVVVDEMSQELGLVLATATSWRLAEDAFKAILERQAGIQHACEGETSMVLALRPELVALERLQGTRSSKGPELAEIAGPQVYRWRSFVARTESGVRGVAEAGTAEKGERLLEAAAEALAALIGNTAFWQLPSR